MAGFQEQQAEWGAASRINTHMSNQHIVIVWGDIWGPPTFAFVLSGAHIMHPGFLAVHFGSSTVHCSGTAKKSKYSAWLWETWF